MTNRQKFVESYARRLRTHWAANPQLYDLTPPLSFIEQAEKNIDRILSLEADLSIIVQMTMREYGLDQTYDSLRNYLLSNET